MDLRPTLYVTGLLLVILAIGLVIPMAADLYFGNEDWRVFFVCIVITCFFGGSLVLANSGHQFTISTRQAFLLTFISWVTLVIFAALPFRFSSLDMSFTDAFFEAMSGITTTGSTVINDLESAPPGILLWRAILQWLGGIGIIIMAMSVLPFLKVGGMQIFRTELSESEKALPRTAQLASSIGMIYLGLTILCILAYMITGMQTFDALAHALTTISTGGFSTYDASLGHFQSLSIEIVAVIFMIIGGMPFVLYLKAIRGNILPLLKDTQVQWFLSITALTSMLILGNLWLHHEGYSVSMIIEVIFNVTSIITGTGYVNADYGLWGAFPVSIFFFLMCSGACAGSTSCGIKIFRFQVLYAVTKVQIKRLIHPNGVFIPTYNGKPIPEDVPMSVMGFFFLFALSFAVIVMALSFVGLDYLTAMSGAVTAISNVGPALGEIIGPSGTFHDLPDSAKWILSTAMLVGRLEIFTVLAIMHPNFWKR